MRTLRAPVQGSLAELRPATLRFLEDRRAPDRKARGQYFTPRAVRTRLLDLLSISPGMRVLDPGAGTGELLLDVLERQPGAQVHGWELDPELVRLCRDEHGLRDVVERDALAEPPTETFDLVVGNPPYYEVNGDPRLRERFADVISGRPNVFSMFFRAGVEALAPGGRLAFVVPPSMNNGAYFEALRRWILERAEIEHLVLLDDPSLFEGAQQSVMLIVLRKGARGDGHVFRADLGGAERTPLFTADPRALERSLEGMHTLASLGLVVRTGRCVWNERKDDLRFVADETTVPLVWAHNVTDAPDVVWTPDHPTKPQHVRETRPNVGPAIVVNRITGAVGKGALRAALVPSGQRFVAENHVNVVQPRPELLDRAIDHRGILDGLRHPRVRDTLRALTGNTQLSSVELAHLVPVLAKRGR